MIADPDMAHRADRLLFDEIRRHFDLREQAAVRRILDAHLRPLADDLCRSPEHARQLVRVEPERVCCAATKSNGQPCARWPAPGQALCSAHRRQVLQFL
ncbi:hypothetical protein [Patulibacter medicamentivorans]|uniref:hypothetical protein n=1 Tax=Patulibacter medicamentivorans TaxID=1097667 RepID=UPI001478403F|nr:hypothetical protein [Patulibacter medicamentivorans]